MTEEEKAKQQLLEMQAGVARARLQAATRQILLGRAAIDPTMTPETINAEAAQTLAQAIDDACNKL